MSEKKDWNAIFAERKAARDKERAQRLSDAKEAAAKTDKEPFDAVRFRELYSRINADDVDQYTPWDTLIRESEYDYYVNYKDKMTLTELIEHIKYLQGFG